MANGSNGSQVITVYTNSGENANASTWDLSVSDIGYSSGTLLTEVLTCTNYTVGSDGSLSFPMSAGQPRILYSAASLSNSSLCGEGGEMFDEKVTNQTVTMTTYTTTIGSTPTVMVASATMPIGQAEQTGGTATPTASSAAVPQFASLSLLGPLSAVIALAIANGVVLSLLGR